VYSFGSKGDDTFERGIKTLAPQCDIHTFDPGNFSGVVAGPPTLTYHRVGLTGEASVKENHSSLRRLMKLLGHDHIDVLKIDIEGEEYKVLPEILTPPSSSTNSGGKHIPIGQIQVELYFWYGRTHPNHNFPIEAHRSMMNLLALFHNAGMYLFHCEVNLEWTHGIELSFVNISALPIVLRPNCV
jgi:hypothetical protein